MAKYKYYYKNITIITEDIINYYKNNPKIAEKQYQSLIKSKKTFIKSENDAGYYEKHHILPRSMGGDNESDNLVTLTYSEHIIAHLLLYAINSDNYKMLYAFSLMCGKHDGKDNFIKRRIYSNVIEETDIQIDLEVLENIRIQAANHPGRKERMKEVQSDPKYLENQRQKTTARWQTEKYREKVLSKNRKRWADPEYRKKQSKSLKEAWKNPEKRKLWQKNRDTEEYRQTLRNARAEVLSRPEFQEKMKQIRESEEYKQHIHEASVKMWEDDKYQTIFCKRVLGPDGNVCRSIKEASEIYGVPRTTLTDWLRHKPEKGYKFIDEDEYQSRKNN